MKLLNDDVIFHFSGFIKNQFLIWKIHTDGMTKLISPSMTIVCQGTWLVHTPTSCHIWILRFKVTRVVNIIVGFMDWFLCYFIILIKQCKVPYKTLQSSIIFEKRGILSKKLKTLTSSNFLDFNIFVKILHTFPTYQCLQKGVRDFFYFV